MHGKSEVRLCMIEDTLKAIFDFQRFEGNDELETLIRDTFSRWGAALSEDELEQVSAAGEPSPPPAGRRILMTTFETPDAAQIYLDYRDKVTRYVRSRVNNAHDAEDLVSARVRQGVRQAAGL